VLRIPMLGWSVPHWIYGYVNVSLCFSLKLTVLTRFGILLVELFAIFFFPFFQIWDGHSHDLFYFCFIYVCSFFFFAGLLYLCYVSVSASAHRQGKKKSIGYLVTIVSCLLGVDMLFNYFCAWFSGRWKSKITFIVRILFLFMTL